MTETQGCRAARILYQTRMVQQRSQRSSNWSPQFQDIYSMLLKEEGISTVVNTVLSQRVEDEKVMSHI